ncbi:hypothetical protein KVR01_011046 [Diaporthe batatas]|uniref:uncharacterized protein n=1 Tax=Diaporthe batatas TaxID=748121 RepID=UPI001D038E87|nr:uncharacterized protein KVR01_011046 [Diaporthe batatas]KAG8159385.1 hypothetical protein KVR01_011046 [Diaporthe batatas]
MNHKQQLRKPLPTTTSSATRRQPPKHTNMSSTTHSSKSGPNQVVDNESKNGYNFVKPSTWSNGQAEDSEFKVPVGATAQLAENDDEALPGVPGPDHSARDTLRKQAKPVFNRGPSMLDFTAVTSAGPTPAGEVPPSASYFDGSRLRESHLPDMELKTTRRQTVTATDLELPSRVPGGEVQGADGFAPRTSRG